MDLFDVVDLEIGEIRCMTPIADNLFAVGSSKSVVALVAHLPEEGKTGIIDAHVGHGTHAVYCMQYLPKYNLLVTGGADFTIRVYTINQERLEPLAHISGPVNRIASVSISPSLQVAATDWSGHLYVFTTEGTLLKKEVLDPISLTACRFFSSDLLLVGGSSGKLMLYNTRTFKIESELEKAHQSAIRSISRVDVLKGCFQTCGNDGEIKWWVIEENRFNCVGSFKNNFAVKEFYFSSIMLESGGVSAVGGEALAIMIFDRFEPKLYLPVPSTVWALASVSNEQSRDLYAGCEDGKIYCFRKSDQINYPGDILETISESSYLADNFNLPSTLSDTRPEMTTGQIWFAPPVAHAPENAVSTMSLQCSEDTAIRVGHCVRDVRTMARKKYYKGQFYDVVIDITAPDGSSTWKLPINIGDNAWDKAAKFCADNHLDTRSYQQEISEFIINNMPKVASLMPDAPLAKHIEPLRAVLNDKYEPFFEALAGSSPLNSEPNISLLCKAFLEVPQNNNTYNRLYSILIQTIQNSYDVSYFLMEIGGFKRFIDFCVAPRRNDLGTAVLSLQAIQKIITYSSSLNFIFESWSVFSQLIITAWKADKYAHLVMDILTSLQGVSDDQLYELIAHLNEIRPYE